MTLNAYNRLNTAVTSISATVATGTYNVIYDPPDDGAAGVREPRRPKWNPPTLTAYAELDEEGITR